MKSNLWSLFKTFLVTIITAFIVTNEKNPIYSFLDNIEIKNEVFRKSFLSAAVALLIGVIGLFIVAFFQWMCLTFSKIELEMEIKQNNRKLSKIVFTPDSNNEYPKETINLEVKMHPKGKVSNIVAKWFDVNLEIYFNPNVIDVSLAEQWEQASLNGFAVSERCIKVHILKPMNIQGEKFLTTEHTMSEKIEIKPIRVKKQSTYLDYCPTFGNGNFFLNRLAKRFLKVKYNQFKIDCEEGL
ncbi:hypothetical protein [Enterococcus sp. DIV0756]|uniref:hypothetical protein n=1 Tax=Enterococcus sp. DIV0756 TaxID=2774636 RepID=UPI003F232FB8